MEVVKVNHVYLLSLVNQGKLSKDDLHSLLNISEVTPYPGYQAWFNSTPMFIKTPIDPFLPPYTVT